MQTEVHVSVAYSKHLYQVPEALSGLSFCLRQMYPHHSNFNVRGFQILFCPKN